MNAAGITLASHRFSRVQAVLFHGFGETDAFQVNGVVQILGRDKARYSL